MKKLILFLLFPIILLSCREYKYKCEIYYIDGSTRIINYKGYDDPWVEADRGSYVVRLKSQNIDDIKGVDRVDILKKSN